MIVVALAAIAAAVFLRSPDAVQPEAAEAAPPTTQTATPRIEALPSTLFTVLSQQPAPEPGLTEQVDRLLATHDPVKAFAAYTLIRDCATFNRDHDRAVYDLAEVTSKRSMLPYRGMTDVEKRHDTALCSSMSERMRLSRIDYLAEATRAGVEGAVEQMAHEGPFGDITALTSRPDDPLVQEWKRTVRDQLTTSAEAGDMGALSYLWIGEWTGNPVTGKNTALAYRYLLAQGLILRDLTGANNPASDVYAPEGPLARSMEGLSAEQRMAELAAAQHIADVARAQRGRK